MSFDICAPHGRVIGWQQGPLEENESLLHLVHREKIQAAPVPGQCIDFLFDGEALVTIFVDLS